MTRTRTRTHTLFAATLLLALAGPLDAQRTPAPGTPAVTAAAAPAAAPLLAPPTVRLASGTAASMMPASTRLALVQDRGTHRWTGALVGFVVGAGATYWILRQGGSTAMCDQKRNQDAIEPRECAAAAAAGGAAGAAIGFVIGGRIRR
jgi:hypothetical protein